MNKGNVVHIHSGVFLRHNENNAICLKKMDGTKGYCIESTKPLSQRQMPHTLSHGSLGLKNVTITLKMWKKKTGSRIKVTW